METFDCMPLAGSITITQRFGENPVYYQQFGLPGHEGLDLRAMVGDPVYAVWDGIVVRVGADMQHPYGNFVTIEHEDGYRTTYAHLSRVDVEISTLVYHGTVIGAAGNTGNSHGSHLHLTLKRDGEYLDPEPYLPRTK